MEGQHTEPMLEIPSQPTSSGGFLNRFPSGNRSRSENWPLSQRLYKKSHTTLGMSSLCA